jgi:2-haloalkanoic acid dehalogenase type II
MTSQPQVVLFDLLTALLDSWSLWNAAAGDPTRGRAWRAEYLRLTYGCGAYQPYEDLVRQAAQSTALGLEAVSRLQENWDSLAPWDDAQDALGALASRTKLGVVTNCSRGLGQRAAARLPVRWDVVITAEEAGYYKPHPAPYLLALRRLSVDATQARFVAGSAYDLFGTSQVGLRTYWHNRVGLNPPVGAPRADVESRTLAHLPAWVLAETQ